MSEKMKLVMATGNKNKIIEMKRIFSDRLGENAPDILSLKDIGFSGDIVEDGATFEENAEIKARAVHDFCSLPVFADDSGLCVNALGGAPGIYSARYSGSDKDDAENIKKLLFELKGKSDRSAYFVCAVAYIDKNGVCTVFRGECHGVIAGAPAGESGFGYDPVFYVEERGMTFAQLGPEVKNRISHRAAATDAFIEHIRKELDLC